MKKKYDTGKPRKVKMSTLVDREVFELFESWRKQSFNDDHGISKSLRGLISIYLGIKSTNGHRLGNWTMFPGFNSAWSRRPGFESVIDPRSQAKQVAKCRDETHHTNNYLRLA